MGLCLIASSLGFVGGVLMAAAGLGFVIFVHELGHFAVARMCGVKCEKFMIGFDFGGLKISRKWGETVYGIGVFPLGGYVKMLGQDDDPSKIAEQMDASQVEGGSEYAKEITGPDGKKRYIDRRSYQAKSVPKRMAIISAGVIMNLIFAFIFALIAFGIGVEYPPCIISETTPGGPAWRAALSTGDEIIQIGDRKAPSYQHLVSGVVLSDMEEGVRFVVRRAADGEEEEIILNPIAKNGGAPKIGVLGPRSTRLYPKGDITKKNSAAAKAEPSFKNDDQVISVNGTPVSNYREYVAATVPLKRESIELVVRRSNEEAGSSKASGEEANEKVTIRVGPQQARRLGLVMTMGPIVAVQQGSPAEEAGLKAGDQILAIGGQKIGAVEEDLRLDPANLSGLFTEPGSPVTLLIARETEKGGSSEELEIAVTPREVTWRAETLTPDTPMSLAALGVAYTIEPTVAAVMEGSPAEDAGIATGDVVSKMVITLPSDEEKKKPKEQDPIEFGPEAENWPKALYVIRRLPAEATVALTLGEGEESREVKLQPTLVEDFYLDDRGLAFMSEMLPRKTTGFADQAWHAWDRTTYDLMTVVRTVQKLFSQQVPAGETGGPIMIAQTLYKAADAGIPTFLLLLTFLSANLAVLNFLPIPVLDGGHMVFLAWEGITGKPANEKLTIVMTLIGMVLLLALMVYVTKNDIMRIFS